MQSSLFLTRLPLEVRCQIYNLLLKDAVFEVKYQAFGLKWHDDKSMNIAKTCRTCRSEAIGIFQEQSIIQVDTFGILALKGYTGMFNRNRIRRIRLVSNATQDPDSEYRVVPLQPQPAAPPQPPVQQTVMSNNFQGPPPFPVSSAWTTRRAIREEPEIVLSNCMLHCLDVFFDLTHLQLQPSLEPKLRMLSSGEPTSELMHEVIAQPSLRTECFQDLLKKQPSLKTYLDILHNTLQTRTVAKELKIELVVPLLIDGVDHQAESLEVKPFGTISIDIQKRRLSWHYDDKDFHFTDFGWEKPQPLKKVVVVENESEEE